MNEDFFLYKKRFVSFFLLFSYAFIHLKLSGIYVDTTFAQLTDFSARLPYGQRILVPMLVHYLRFIVPLENDLLFFLMEWLFISLFYFALLRLMQCEFPLKQAQALSWLFLLLLPLVTLINYRYSIHGAAPIFFPYDTASIFFMCLGFLFCLKNQWIYFMVVVFFATINRESSFLLLFMIPTLHWQKLSKVYKQFILAILVYILARCLVMVALHDLPGSLVEWYFRGTHHTHFEVN